ncbi:sulfurtransferase [Mycetocola tolaasinivorans]|uniref:Sulfurtransferase n=1 Tax=Mycetocola tolaasinivorans TaxID=76635 RepID=A0A3L7A363_9MICO|nr:rhodanese-like domain-containing protein [Mycetocola tolaasinivorans]RLP73712.1 sulfurtransferase [Mycetocola tolaasinivorans]
MSPVFESPVVSTQWLADHLGSSALVVIDATVMVSEDGDYRCGRAHFERSGHIPSARFADLLSEFSHPDAPGLHRPDPACLAAAVARLGITPESRVVVYDTQRGQWAARLWWLLRTAGFDEVAVLDGGLTAWLSEHRSVETGTGSVVLPRSEFVPTPRPELWVDPVSVGAESALTPVTVVSGSRVALPRTGPRDHALSVPLTAITRASDHTLVSDARLRELYAPALRSGLPIITADGGEVTASATALALALAGARDVRVLDGSLPLVPA